MISLANTPMPRDSASAHGVLDLFYSRQPPDTIHRPIPAPEPNPEPNPGPDAIRSKCHTDIATADWDDLFRALQLRLEQCVDDALHKTPELASKDRHAVTKAAVLECVADMRHLHDALIIERQQQALAQSQQPQQLQQQQQMQQQQQAH